MTGRDQSDKIRIVGDFVCETIPETNESAGTPVSRGKSEGVRVISEFIVDLDEESIQPTPPDVTLR